MEKITYASHSALSDESHRAFESALYHELKKLDQSHPILINGRAHKSKVGTFTTRCPANTKLVVGRFQKGTREHARSAVSAAKSAGGIWRELGWEARVSFLRKTAELMVRHQFDLAALLCLEVGKPRREALAEVWESIDFIQYYCQQVERHHGYDFLMAGNGAELTRTVLRPYGVWAVVTPFSFPLALPTGAATAALLGGNTVVLKPSSLAPCMGLRLSDLMHEAGLPVGVFNVVTGAGSVVAEEWAASGDVDGMAFAGSREVGMGLLQKLSKILPRPCVAEMGGNNPVIVMPTAHLDDAAEGVLGSAFGLAGQNRAACSRVYVHRQVVKAFTELLVLKSRARRVGDPQDRETQVGPLISGAAVERFRRAVAAGKRRGRLVCGGPVLKKGVCAMGNFVEPAILDRMSAAATVIDEEWFAPVLTVTEVKSLGEAITLANATSHGLGAGLFSGIEGEQEEFFERIMAGMAFCNRRGGATSGAWPGVQSSGGWKGSGTTGKNALGPYYVPQFMREQSRTLARRSGVV